MAFISITHRPGIAENLRGLAERIRAANARRALFRTTLAELASLSDRDLADIGIARANIREIARAHAYGA